MAFKPFLIWILLVAIVVLPCPKTYAEDGSGVRLLKPKSLNPELKKERPRKRRKAIRSRRRRRPLRHFETVRFSALLHTPLIRERGIHNRFAAVGLDGLLSLPIAKRRFSY